MRYAICSIATIFLAVTALIGTRRSVGEEALKAMNIYGHRQAIPSVLGSSEAWDIFADGIIDEGASNRLEKFLDANAIPGDSSIYLNSNGGSLVEGMKLGRLIRKRGLFTYVGSSDPKTFKIDPGECYSACSLAFLGGVFRFSYGGSWYGVHRFYSAPGGDPIDSDTAQIMSAAVVGYIEEMGISPSLFGLMTEAGSDEIRLLSNAEQSRLDVVNNGEGPTKWTVESEDGRLYLQGERQTWRGLNRFIIACLAKRQIGLMVLFDLYKRGHEVQNDTRVHWLVIDGEYPDSTIIPITQFQIGPIETDEDRIVAKYMLTRGIVERLLRARSVGVSLKKSADSNIFTGFYGMDFADGLRKLPGLLNLCTH